MLNNEAVHPSGYNGNESQSVLQWMCLDGHLTQGNQSLAREAIPECNWPIREAWEARQATP